MADMPEATIKGRAVGAGTGEPQDLTRLQAAEVVLGRRVLFEPLTLYFRQGGTGANLGFAKGSGAWGHPQDAVNWVDANVFTNGFDVTFAQDDTASFPDTYTGDEVISITKPLCGGGVRIFQGSSGNEDDVRLVTNPDGRCISVTGMPGEVRFTENWWTRSEGGSAVLNQQRGRVIIDGTLTMVSNTTFGSCLVNQDEGTHIGVDGTLKFDCDAGVGIFNDSGTFHDNGQIEIVGARTFSTAFYDGNFFSQGYLCNINPFIGSFTGRRLLLRDRAVLRLQAPANGVIPGTLRGAAQPGSVFSVAGATANVMCGTKTFGSGATSAVVDFSDLGLPDQYDTNYQVMIGGGDVARRYVVRPADRLTTGFTITASATATGDTVWWRLEWLPT